ALAEVAWLLDLLAQENVLLADAERHRPQPVAHAPVGDHVPGQARGLLQVILMAGECLAVNQTVSGPAAHASGQPCLPVVQAMMVPVLVRRVEGDTQALPAGDDGYLLRRIHAWLQPTNQGMAGLMIGGPPLPLGSEDLLALGPHEHPVGGPLKVTPL